MAKGILSLSGGLDSSTLLAEFKDQIDVCVFFDYGSKHNAREFRAAEGIASHYNKKLYRLDLKSAFLNFKSALLISNNEAIEEGEYSQKETCNALVPFRNGIFSSFLVGLAESFGCNLVYLGVHAGDHKIYPDCSPQFVSALGKLIRAYNPAIDVCAPFLNFSKKEIAKIALSNGLPIDLTYSCYNGGEEHCRKCPTCIERDVAIREGKKEREK